MEFHSIPIRKFHFQSNWNGIGIPNSEFLEISRFCEIYPTRAFSFRGTSFVAIEVSVDEVTVQDKFRDRSGIPEIMQYVQLINGLYI